jgi:putative FmdB family regulatory protein
MPVYEYQCQACQREFEYQQRMADPEKTVCEACGGGLERIISRTAFQLKGSGWYKDLYSSTKPEASVASATGEASAKSDGAATPATPAPSAAPTAAPSAPVASAAAAPSTTSSGSGSSGGGSSTGGS